MAPTAADKAAAVVEPVPRDKSPAQLPTLVLSAVTRLSGHTDWVTHLAMWFDACHDHVGWTCGGSAPAASDSDTQAVLARHGAPPALLCSGSRDHSVRIWSLAGESSMEGYGACLHVLRGHSRWISGLRLGHRSTAFTGVGGVFAVSASADGMLRVYTLSDGACVGVLRGHTRHVTDLDVRGTRVVSASMDRTVRVWELAPLFVGPSPAGVSSLSTSVPSQLGGECRERPSETATGLDTAVPLAPQPMLAADGSGDFELAELLCLRKHTDFVRCVHFDHQRVISCGEDNHICICSFVVDVPAEDI